MNVQGDLVKAQYLLNEPGSFVSNESCRLKNLGAKDVAVARPFAAHHLRGIKDKRSIILGRKGPEQNHNHLATLLRSL